MNRLKASTTLWLQGGLGNQLFQLNAGLHMADVAATPFLVSAASFRRNRLRDLSLHGLGDILNFTSAWEDFVIGPPHNRRGVLRDQLGPLNLKVTQSLSENRGCGQVAIGYFQDEQSLALDSASVRTPLLDLRKVLMSSHLARMIDNRPVAHVRRGDYSTNPAAIRTFGSIRPAYYYEALEHLDAHAEDAVFFTDDPIYVRETFGVRPEHIVGPDKTKSDLESLLLMSLGKSLIIPNSTFSWWAAELMEAGAEIVAPQDWFKDRQPDFNLARSSWKKLPN